MKDEFDVKAEVCTAFYAEYNQKYLRYLLSQQSQQQQQQR